MDAAIAAVLRQAAAAIGEPERAAHVERVASEARGDLAYLSGDDSDDSDDDGWEYAACPDAEQRFEAVESALAYRYASSTFQDADLDAVAHRANNQGLCFWTGTTARRRDTCRKPAKKSCQAPASKQQQPSGAA